MGTVCFKTFLKSFKECDSIQWEEIINLLFLFVICLLAVCEFVVFGMRLSGSVSMILSCLVYDAQFFSLIILYDVCMMPSVLKYVQILNVVW